MGSRGAAPYNNGWHKSLHAPPTQRVKISKKLASSSHSTATQRLTQMHNPQKP
jgi:hypothetical protein